MAGFGRVGELASGAVTGWQDAVGTAADYWGKRVNPQAEMAIRAAAAGLGGNHILEGMDEQRRLQAVNGFEDTLGTNGTAAMLGLAQAGPASMLTAPLAAVGRAAGAGSQGIRQLALQGAGTGAATGMAQGVMTAPEGERLESGLAGGLMGGALGAAGGAGFGKLQQMLRAKVPMSSADELGEEFFTPEASRQRVLESYDRIMRDLALKKEAAHAGRHEALRGQDIEFRMALDKQQKAKPRAGNAKTRELKPLKTPRPVKALEQDEFAANQ